MQVRRSKGARFCSGAEKGAQSWLAPVLYPGATWSLSCVLEQRLCPLSSLSVDAGEVNSISVDWFTGQLYWASSHPAAIYAGLGDGRGFVTVLGKDVAPEQLTVYPSAR